MNSRIAVPEIDAYLRRRLMPVEGAIPQLSGIDMYGNSMPAATVGGDLFEYINFQQRYNIGARIATAHRLAQEYLEELPDGAAPRNEVDKHAQWLRSKGYSQEEIENYRKAKSSEQLRVAENLNDLFSTAGVLLVDAQGHGVIAAKIASTVHDTFHAFMLSDLDDHGKPTPGCFEKINLRLAQSVTARNALGWDEGTSSREIATLFYGEVRPHGEFRFLNFGSPPPLIFSAEYDRFVDLVDVEMVQFAPLGLGIPEEHPDFSRYVSMTPRKALMKSSDVGRLTLMNLGDIVFLYTDGVLDGSDYQERNAVQGIISAHKDESAKTICNAVLDYAVTKDDLLRVSGQEDRIDDKTVFIIKRT